MGTPTRCRLCEAMCELDVDLTITSKQKCNRPLDSLTNNRLSFPKKGTIEVDWEEAIDEIATSLSKIRSRFGPNSIALYDGDPNNFDSEAAFYKTLFMNVIASKNIFSTKMDGMKQVTKMMFGKQILLQSDIEVAQHLLVLGPSLQQKRPKKSRTTIANSHKLSDLTIKPGTELYLLLGMCNAIINNNWYDSQYINDYCDGFEELKTALNGYTPSKAELLCGLEPGSITGEALRFKSAPMASIFMDESALLTENASLIQWARLVLSALTANLLRPGGLYVNPGFLGVARKGHLTGFLANGADKATEALIQKFHSDPRPATSLAENINKPIKALICLHGDPTEYPNWSELKSLDLIVNIGVNNSRIDELATFSLPTTHFLERSDQDFLQRSVKRNSIAKPLGSVRPAGVIFHDILKKMTKINHVKLDSGIMGIKILQKLLDATSQKGNDKVDRARWAVYRKTGKIDLAPTPLLQALSNHNVNLSDGLVSYPISNLKISLSDNANIKTLIINTPTGQHSVDSMNNDNLRDGVIGIPANLGELYSSEPRDPFSGSIRKAGMPIKIVDWS